MALALTSLNSGSASSMGTGSWSSTSFTPPDNSILVVMLGVVDNNVGNIASSLTVSGGGLTYTQQVVKGVAGGFRAQGAVWTAPVTTGASMTVTFDCGTASIDSSNWWVFALTGYNTSTPVGATASGTLGNGSDNSADGAFSITLSGSPASDSYVLAMMSLDGDTTGTVGVTPGSTFTEQGEVGGTGTHTYAETEYRTGSTSTTVDWVDTRTGTMHVFSAVGLAVEIQAAAGGGGGTTVKSLSALGVG